MVFAWFFLSAPMPESLSNPPRWPNAYADPIQMMSSASLPSAPYAELHCRTNFSFLEAAAVCDGLMLAINYIRKIVVNRKIITQC